jgi:hypothetical protein
MQNAPRLRRFGDKTEQRYWDRLRRFIPHYEEFWQLYVVPLRAPDSIWFRRDIDPREEKVAIASYSTFVALGRAYEQVFTNQDGFRHIEEVYMAIQRAGEVGMKLIDAFAALEVHLQNRPSTLSTVELDRFIKDRLSRYRNLLHQPILPMPKLGKRRKIPKPNCIDRYQLWTTVMYDYDDEDFVFASVQAKDDFTATCSRLEDVWKAMCSRYSSLHRVRKPLIFDATQKVMIQGSLVGGPPASGDIYIGSDSEHVEPARRFHIQHRGPEKRKAK